MSSSPAVPAVPAAPAAPQSYKSLEDLVGLLSGIAAAVIAAPKPLTVADLSQLLPLLPQMETVVGELGDIPAELKAMTYGEGTALVAIIASKLSVADAKAVAIINASLQLVQAGMALAAAIKA